MSLRLSLRLSLLAGLLVAFACGRAYTQRADPKCNCLPFEDVGRSLFNSAVHVVTDSRQPLVATRERLGIQQLPADSVRYITDHNTCAAAMRAYRAQLTGRAPEAFSSGVHVVQFGHLYFVVDPAVQAGEWLVAMTFTNTFVLVERWLM